MIKNNALIAQSVEQLPFKQTVPSSSLGGRTHEESREGFFLLLDNMIIMHDFCGIINSYKIWIESKNMIDQQIVEYIKNSLALGKTKEDLYRDLLGQGLTIEAIQENFNAINAEQTKEDHSKRTINIIVTIGAVLIGAGIFSFIAANWQSMPNVVKVGIILSAMFFAYGAGWFMKEKYGFQKTGDALILLGAIIYGAGIFLVAQMFNIRANWPDGFILWMIGAIAMGFAIESYPLLYLSIPLGIFAVVGHPLSIFNSFGPDAFLLTSSFLLLAATIITFISGWAIRKRMPPELKEIC